MGTTPKITDAQANVIGRLISAHIDVGYEINPFDVFPWRDAEGNGLRRTLNNLGKKGVLIHAPAYPSHIQIWQMTQEALDAYRAWYMRRGFNIGAHHAMLD